MLRQGGPKSTETDPLQRIPIRRDCRPELRNLGDVDEVLLMASRSKAILMRQFGVRVLTTATRRTYDSCICCVCIEGDTHA